MRARRGDDQIRGVQRVRRFVRVGQNRMPNARLAVNLARIPHRDGHGRRRARPDGDIRSPGKRENRACVACRGREGNVADDRGDAEDSRLVMRAGVEQRERIVDAGIDVEDERLCKSVMKTISF